MLRGRIGRVLDGESNEMWLEPEDLLLIERHSSAWELREWLVRETKMVDVDCSTWFTFVCTVITVSEILRKWIRIVLCLLDRICNIPQTRVL